MTLEQWLSRQLEDSQVKGWSTMQFETEKIARELALQSKHKNEGLWELALMEATDIWLRDRPLAQNLMKAYDARKKAKRVKG